MVQQTLWHNDLLYLCVIYRLFNQKENNRAQKKGGSLRQSPTRSLCETSNAQKTNNKRNVEPSRQQVVFIFKLLQNKDVSHPRGHQDISSAFPAVTRRFPSRFCVCTSCAHVEDVTALYRLCGVPLDAGSGGSWASVLNWTVAPWRRPRFAISISRPSVMQPEQWRVALCACAVHRERTLRSDFQNKMSNDHGHHMMSMCNDYNMIPFLSLNSSNMRL